jgi:uncharacterized protein YecT (DUF1311 family)
MAHSGLPYAAHKASFPQERHSTGLPPRRMDDPSMKNTITLLAIAALAAPFARAQTQGEMNAETAAEFNAADKQLNSIYQEILSDYADDEVFIASLKEAQRCWIAFRDAQLKMKYPDREPGYYGSVLPSCEAMYLTELTNDRIKALRVWVDGVEEGNVCAGTVRIKPQ